MTDPERNAPSRSADSPRWCEVCKAYGDHHTDRHPAAPAPDPEDRTCVNCGHKRDVHGAYRAQVGFRCNTPIDYVRLGNQAPRCDCIGFQNAAEKAAVWLRFVEVVCGA